MIKKKLVRKNGSTKKEPGISLMVISLIVVVTLIVIVVSLSSLARSGIVDSKLTSKAFSPPSASSPPSTCTIRVVAEINILGEGDPGDDHNFRIWAEVDSKNPITEAITVSFGTKDGAAKAEEDYDAAFGTLTINPGEVRSEEDTIHIISDDLFEEEYEDFDLVITGVEGISNCTLKNYDLLIRDDDFMRVRLHVDPYTVREKDVPEDNVIIGVWASLGNMVNPFDSDLRIRINTQDDTAKAGSDYESTVGYLSIKPGDDDSRDHETEDLVDVPIIEDEICETRGTEYFDIKVSGISPDSSQYNVDIVETRGVIFDDDLCPSSSPTTSPN